MSVGKNLRGQKRAGSGLPPSGIPSTVQEVTWKVFCFQDLSVDSCSEWDVQWYCKQQSVYQELNLSQKSLSPLLNSLFTCTWIHWLPVSLGSIVSSAMNDKNDWIRMTHTWQLKWRMDSDPCNKQGSISAAGSPSPAPAREWLGQIKVGEFNYEQGN